MDHGSLRIPSTSIYIHTHTYSYTHTYIHTYMCPYMYIYMYTHVDVRHAALITQRLCYRAHQDHDLASSASAGTNPSPGE